ncbi:MAG: ABC transporter permease, partial [Gemmatimonadaceae bacterium]
MMRFSGFRRTARVPAERTADVVREVDEELAFHLAMREERLRARGLSPDAATAEARRRFGDVDAVRAECVDSDAAELRSLRWHESAADVARDLRIAFRSLRRSPGFAVAAASLLALGIGGTTSVFSIVDAIYFRPLPYPNADRLAIAQATFPDPRCGGRCARQPTMAEVALWQRQARSIDAVGALELRQGEVDVAAGSLVLEGAAVSAELPAMLGLHAAVGRVFVPTDFAEGAPGVIVLGHAAWESEFGGDSAVVGQTATIDSASYRIVGVLSPESELGSPLYSFNARTAAYLVPQDRWSTTVHQ